MTGPGIQLENGSVVHVAPPVLPPIEAAPPTVTPAVVVPVTGPPGPRGPAGDGGTVYRQDIPQAVWTVVHGLGHEPTAWSLFDADGALCGEYQVEHLDENTVRVSMDIPTAGTLRLI